MIISRLKEDIPSKTRSGYIHKAGTEIAPVKRLSLEDDLWEIEIRTDTDEGPWWEKLVIRRDQSEIVDLDG